jgi:hypothetical protein
MKALFITTQTNDTHNHIDAWDSVSDTKAMRVQFNYNYGVGTDAYILNKAKAAGEVDVIFYIGANRGGGLPSFEALRELRKIAPLINIISDAADPPWHRPIKRYREEECFDLQVGIDGDPKSPVDHVTLTPVDGRIFDSVEVERDIHCGFSGNVGGKRGRVLAAVGSRCFVRLRGDDYLDHVGFIKRCQMVLNVAYTGSGHRFHVKGRVTEAGYAGAALLEPIVSPTKHWFPKIAYIGYRSTEHLIELIETLRDETIATCAQFFSEIVREKYNAAAIYGGMLEKVNLVSTLKSPTA